MRATRWTRVLAAAVISGACLVPAQASAQAEGNGRAYAPGQGKKQTNREQYYRGYQQGLREGEQDAQRNRPFSSASWENGRRNVDADFRNGLADGYRDGYYQVRGQERNNGGLTGGVAYPRDDRREGGVVRRAPGAGGYQEPAFARGYSDGYEDGVNDGRDRNRYDPVGEKDYRSADQGYSGNYGSKDAYKNNYRAGFRQGYEEGYREGNLRRR